MHSAAARPGAWPSNVSPTPDARVRRRRELICVPLMQFASMRPIARPRLAWLVWFALLFPVAQAAAAVHAVSHLARDAGRAPEGGFAHQIHCDLCLTAASIGGGAPLDEPAAPIHPALRHEQPGTVVSIEGSVPPAHPYRSRAPPFASH